MRRLLAMHDTGECILLAIGCPCCGTFNPDSDISELEADDLAPGSEKLTGSLDNRPGAAWRNSKRNLVNGTT
jgi:hypothetical protein